MTFYAGRWGREASATFEDGYFVHAEHLTYSGRNISSAYFRDRVATCFASGLLLRVKGTGVGPEVLLAHI